jgi:D-serine dehydratase
MKNFEKESDKLSQLSKFIENQNDTINRIYIYLDKKYKKEGSLLIQYEKKNLETDLDLIKTFFTDSKVFPNSKIIQNEIEELIFIQDSKYLLHIKYDYDLITQNISKLNSLLSYSGSIKSYFRFRILFRNE